MGKKWTVEIKLWVQKFHEDFSSTGCSLLNQGIISVNELFVFSPFMLVSFRDLSDYYKANEIVSGSYYKAGQVQAVLGLQHKVDISIGGPSDEMQD